MSNIFAASELYFFCPNLLALRITKAAATKQTQQDMAVDSNQLIYNLRLKRRWGFELVEVS
ncbi:hypothetical protein ACQKPX_09120 [Photobacterium sp. DNB23_23_1]